MSPARLVWPAPLAAPGTLAADFVAGRPASLGLFPGPAVRAVSDAPASRRGRVPASAFGVSTPEVRPRLERILAGEGWLVTTGQQPLLLLGPLFVVYKALRAIEEARRIEERTGAPALACFWIASDDADWEEVAVARVLGRDHRVIELRIPPPAGREGWAVGPTPLPEAAREVADALLAALGETEFTPPYAALVREACRPGLRFADSFAGLLAGVLDGRPFVWLDSSAGEVRAAAGPLLDRILGAGGGATSAIGAGTRAVESAGYVPQLREAPGALPVFHHGPGGRQRVYDGGGGPVRIGPDGEPRPLAALREELAAHPERFSPAAALRPVVESWLLPVAATVLGPGEIGYWAQLGALFGLAGVPMPRIRSRGSWWVVEGKVRKVLDRLRVGPEAFADGGERLVAEVVAAGRPPAVASALTAFRRETLTSLERVAEAVEGELPGIRSSVGKARAALLDVGRELERVVDGRVRERQQILLAQIRKAAANLFPDGRPQERRVSPFSYLARYGPALLEELEAAERRAEEPAASHVAGPEGAA